MSTMLRVLLVGFAVRPFYTLSLFNIRAYSEADPALRDACHFEVADLDLLEYDYSTLRMDTYLPVATRLQSCSPDVVGLACYVWNHRQVLETAALVKAMRPECCVIIGGPAFGDVTYAAEILRCNPAVDAIATGEGEWVFREVLRALVAGKALASVKGLVVRSGDSTESTGPAPVLRQLDDIPSPHLSDLVNSETSPQYPAFVLLETYRGCPWNCAFCAWSRTSFRRHSLGRIEAEIRHAVAAGARRVFLLDPFFGYNKANAHALLRLIIEYGERCRFSGFVNVRHLDDEMVTLLKAARFQVANLGLQSSNPLAASNAGRPFDLEGLEAAVRLLRANDVDFASIDVMYGIPGDDYRGFCDSVDYAYRIAQAKTFLHYLMVLPGTPFHSNRHAFGLVYNPNPPWQLLHCESYSLDDIVKSKILHIGQDLLCRLFPRLTNELIDRGFGPPSVLFERFGRHCVAEGISSVNVDNFDWIKKLRQYDDELRHRILKGVETFIAEILSTEGDRRDECVKLAREESLNLSRTYLRVHSDPYEYAYVRADGADREAAKVDDRSTVDRAEGHQWAD